MKNLKRFVFATLSIISTASFTANAAFIDFNDYVASDYVNQARSGSAVSSADGSSLILDGNLWVTISDLFEIGADSTLYFTLEATGVEADWYGIGFDDNNAITASNLFQLGGDEGTSANQISSYDFGDGAVDFVIDVGSFFTGSFDKLVFILDADNMAGASLSFSNVELCTDTVNCESLAANNPAAPVGVSAPGAAGLFAISLIALFGRRRYKM